MYMCACVCVSMLSVCTHTCLHTSVWKSKDNLRNYSVSAGQSPCFLRQALSLGLELTKWSRLAGWQASAEPPVSASPALGLQAPSLCVWVLGLELRTWQALKQMSRLPGSVEGRLIHWVVLSLCLPFQLQPTIQLWLGARAPMGAQQCCCCISEKQVFCTNLTSPLCSSGWQRPIHGLP